MYYIVLLHTDRLCFNWKYMKAVSRMRQLAKLLANVYNFSEVFISLLKINSSTYPAQAALSLRSKYNIRFSLPVMKRLLNSHAGLQRRGCSQLSLLSPCCHKPLS